MATGELIRPGVEVLQTFKTASPSFTRPTLAPCVVGPAFEIINVLSTDGTLNSKAKYGVYDQAGKTLAQSSFPNPRGNIDELDVVETSVRPFLTFAGNLSELVVKDGQGSAFLYAFNNGSRAAFTTANLTAGGQALDGLVLVLAFDQTSVKDVSKDIVIQFSGTAALRAADVATQINEAVGVEVATVVDTTYVRIASTTYGATSSVTVRSGGTANSILALGYTAAQHEERIEGFGWRAQNLDNGTTKSSWVEFSRGAYVLDASTLTTPVYTDSPGVAKGGWITPDGTYTATRPTLPDLSSAISLKAGDYFYGDGVKVGGEVMAVEGARFRLGTVNAALSTVDSAGVFTSKIYTPDSLGTIFDGTPFAPSFGYFVANNLSATSAATSATIVGSEAGQTPTQASHTGSVIGATVNLAGVGLKYAVTVDGVLTEGTYTFTGALTQAAIALAITDNIPGLAATVGTNTIIVTTVKYGRTQSFQFIDYGASAVTALGLDTALHSGADTELAGLSGGGVQFTLDGNPHNYLVSFTSNSLLLAADAINAVVGETVATVDAGFHLVVTSTLKGYGSTVKFETTAGGTTLGMSTTEDRGTGRPLPSAYLDGLNNLVLSSNIIRDPVTGMPLDQDAGTADLYIQYKGLRKDVSPSAAVAGVLRIPDLDTLQAALDPLTTENPLGLALFLCMLNAPNNEVKALGVDEITGAAPEGTEAAYARAAAMLESEEIYSVVPLTQSDLVHDLFRVHVVAMSEPEQGGERIVFINKKTPTTSISKIAVSGVNSNTTGNNNELSLDVNPSAGLLAAGKPVTVSGYTVADGVYVEVSVSGSLRRYNVSSVTGTLLTLNTTFTGTQNTDGFYSDVVLVPNSVVSTAYTLKVRGNSLTVPGTNPPRLDRSLVASTVADINAASLSRRVYSVFPDEVRSTIAGVDTVLPGYYACACIAGMVAKQPPQQGFTNFPITGLTGVVGTERYSKKQLNVMAGGGTYVLMQEVEGAPVISRHQVSTDTTSIEKRELSITKVVDFTAKILRLGVRKYIGVNNITEVFLDTVGTTIQGILAFLIETGVLVGANLNNIIQDTTNPDVVLVDVTLDVPYPCNYIRLTLVV